MKEPHLTGLLPLNFARTKKTSKGHSGVKKSEFSAYGIGLDLEAYSR